MPRLWPVCARRREREDTWQAARPRCGRSAHAGARCRTRGGQHALAVASLSTPGRKTGHLAGSTPRLWPVCARRGERRTPGRKRVPAVAGLRTPGREGGHLASNKPRLCPAYARRDYRQDARRASRPGCGRSAHAGARGRTLGRQHAPAVALLRTPGREGGHWQATRPGRGRFALPGRWEDTWQATRPGCGRSAHARAGEKLLGFGDAPGVAVLCSLGRQGGH